MWVNINSENVIIGFGQNIDWLKDFHKIDGLDKNSYKGVDFLNFPVSNYHLVGQSIFILKKSDLPNILYLDIDKNEIKKYSLEKINEKINLYSSIIDLHKFNKILEELKPYHPDKDLEKSVLINLSLKTEIRWKKEINNIMIKTFSEYRERGVPDSLKDIKKIDK